MKITKNMCDEEAQLFKKKPISATNKSVLDRSDCIVVGSRSSRFIFSFVSSKVHPMKSVIVIFTFYLVFFYIHALMKLCIQTSQQNCYKTNEQTKTT